MSVSGNPLAKLKWFVGKRELPSVYSTVDNYASAELAFVPKQEDNMGKLRCEASNPALKHPIFVEKNLNVQFSPALVSVSVRPEHPKAGQNVTLICETASSRPKASITWWADGQQLQGATEMVVDGSDDGGFVTTSHLQLTLSPEHHGTAVTCDARNSILNKRTHQEIRLTVSRKLINMFTYQPYLPAVR